MLLYILKTWFDGKSIMIKGNPRSYSEETGGRSSLIYGTDISSWYRDNRAKAFRCNGGFTEDVVLLRFALLEKV